jgi:hypothetical protein
MDFQTIACMIPVEIRKRRNIDAISRDVAAYGFFASGANEATIFSNRRSPRSGSQ